MTSKKEDIYKKNFDLQGDITITLNAEERMIICESMLEVSSQVEDTIPLLELCNRIVLGK